MVKGFSQYWTKKDLRSHLAVVQGKTAPTKIIKNVNWLNSVRKCWMKGNIWIYEDRIVYVGTELPSFTTENTEIIDATNEYAIPGYIEHHAHPFHLYNPLTFAQYASERGTTTLICDNLLLALQLQKKKALTLIDDLQKTPATILWSMRYDGQTELLNDNDVFAFSKMKAWLDHPFVVQGGELTDWSSLLQGNDQILHWLQQTKDVRKPIEGHLPGAGEKTLAQMALLGINGEHEAMTGEEVLRRLDMGMTVSLRHSSIRPDLPKLLTELHEKGFRQYDKLLLTTDGSSASFYKDGVMDKLIQIAIDHGVPFIEAVHMCTYNVARHLRMDDILGMIAPGRIANINLLTSLTNSLPKAVLAKGEWVRINDQACFPKGEFPWESYGFEPLKINWDLKRDDFHFSIPIGVEMVNDVIVKPYYISQDLTVENLNENGDECFFILIDRHGKWSVTTAVKGFAKDLYGLASSFSYSGDIVLIGKSKQGLLDAFHELKKREGGIFLLDKEKGVVSSITLPLLGIMSNDSLEKVCEQEQNLKRELQQRGYPFSDPIISLLFFSATHLPHTRITQRGIFDVKKKKVLFPSIMR